jgi:hypothetical protein
MTKRLKTRAGRAAYALRQQSVEPVFGIIKSAVRTPGRVPNICRPLPTELLSRCFRAPARGELSCLRSCCAPLRG